MRVRASAKINLSLRVLGARRDGYHELQTIFQSIALHDTLIVRRVNGPLRLTCDDPSLACDRRNLIWRAADALWKSAGRRSAARGVAIHLDKRIPVQAGLGGGSSDAAAALRALQKIWRIDPECVRDAAARLGADVPFFLEGGTALGLGRGDAVFPLIDRPRQWVVIVVPPFGVSTAEAYGWWDRDRRRTRFRPESVQGAPAVNDLLRPVAKRHPEISSLVRALARAGASGAGLSGSGSAVFGLFTTRADAERAAGAVFRPARRTFVTRTVTREEYRTLGSFGGLAAN